MDFDDAPIVFEGVTVEVEDKRKDYGERRIVCYGLLAGRGGDRLHPAWLGAPHIQHAKGQ